MSTSLCVFAYMQTALVSTEYQTFGENIAQLILLASLQTINRWLSHFMDEKQRSSYSWCKYYN